MTPVPEIPVHNNWLCLVSRTQTHATETCGVGLGTKLLCYLFCYALVPVVAERAVDSSHTRYSARCLSREISETCSNIHQGLK